MAVAILKGELDIAATPIERQRKGSLVVNLPAATEQGLTIPDDLKAEATQVIEK